MNCPFCQQQIPDIQINSPHFNWYCETENCKTVIVGSDATIFYYYIQHEGYLLVFWLNLPRFEVMNPVSTVILKLNYLPNITPQNVGEQLSRLLNLMVFS
jgi:hypothetical protein